MDYNIKYGVLKGKTVSQAFEEGCYQELLELKEFLLTSYPKQEKEDVKKLILSGILAIDYYFSKEYSKKINEFFEKYTKLPKEKRPQIDLIALEKNDLIAMNKLLELVK